MWTSSWIETLNITFLVWCWIQWNLFSFLFLFLWAELIKKSGLRKPFLFWCSQFAIPCMTKSMIIEAFVANRQQLFAIIDHSSFMHAWYWWISFLLFHACYWWISYLCHAWYWWIAFLSHACYWWISFLSHAWIYHSSVMHAITLSYPPEVLL